MGDPLHTSDELERLRVQAGNGNVEAAYTLVRYLRDEAGALAVAEKLPKPVRDQFYSIEGLCQHTHGFLSGWIASSKERS